MKHSGKASRAARQLIPWTWHPLVFFLLIVSLAKFPTSLTLALFELALGIWILCAGFILYFFRDPNPSVPHDAKAIVSPAHGKVDLIDETSEPEFMGGHCRRVSIFLSVIDVHVQKAPVAAKISYLKHNAGQFLSALKTESTTLNENVLIGFESGEMPGEKIGVRLIAGVLARRIVPWIALHDVVERGERTSLIQFGSRCDLYLPLNAKIQVKLGDHVTGGETVIALRS